MAEGVGFEPTELSFNGFQDRRLKPLGHPSLMFWTAFILIYLKIKVKSTILRFWALNKVESQFKSTEFRAPANKVLKLLEQLWFHSNFDSFLG